MKLSEYDAFGPWVYEIDSEHTIPAYFEEYIDRSQQPFMMIKIPINKERRNVKPNSVLYDQLVTLYKDKIHILQYQNKRFLVQIIPYSTITAIENSITLLHGELNIFTKDASYSIQYSAVSKDILVKFIKIVRENTSGGEKSLKGSSEINTAQFTYLFNSLLSRMKESENNINIIAYQPEKRVEYSHSNIILKVLKTILDPTVLDSLHLSNNKELIIISQSNCIRYRTSPNYNIRYLYIPFDNIDAVSVQQSQKFRGISEAAVSVGEHKFVFLIETENKSFEYIDQFAA